jgi:hypothetical protein
MFALAARLPTMLPQREYLEAGLISYGPNFLDMNRRAADYVDKIRARHRNFTDAARPRR